MIWELWGMKTAVWAAAFSIGLNLFAAFAGEEEMGPRLPGELAKVTVEQVLRYETAALGCSVRGADREARMRGIEGD